MVNERQSQGRTTERASESQGTPSAIRTLAWLGVFAVLGVAALAFPLLAIPAGLVLWIAWLASPPFGSRGRIAGVAFGLAGVAALAGLMRFVVVHAAPGIVSGGQTAASRRAISRLRELVFAEDAMRRKAFIDPDADGIGSAALLAEMTGTTPLRSGAPLDPPVLSREWRPIVPTPLGPAAEAGGYLFLVCVPAVEGWTAVADAVIDDEQAERRFVAYAWPNGSHPNSREIYFIDEHERILVGRPGETSPARAVGPGHPPSCDAALGGDETLRWEPWADKAPRAHLPGDR